MWFALAIFSACHASFCEQLVYRLWIVNTTFSVSSFARYMNFPIAGSSSSGNLDRRGPESCFTADQSGNLLQSKSNCDFHIETNPFTNCRKKFSSFWETNRWQQSTVTWWWNDRYDWEVKVWYLEGANDFSFPQCLDWIRGPPILQSNGYWWTLSLG